MGCASTPPLVPDEYTGPTAVLSDSGWNDSASRGTLFAAVAVDGQHIRNARDDTRSASFNQGFALTTRMTSRKVKAQPAKVRIVGTHQTAAPIHGIAARMAGTFQSVEGTVDFAPRAGRFYSVTGTLEKHASCVWIADTERFEPVTEKVCNP